MAHKHQNCATVSGTARSHSLHKATHRCDARDAWKSEIVIYLSLHVFVIGQWPVSQPHNFITPLSPAILFFLTMTKLQVYIVALYLDSCTEFG